MKKSIITMYIFIGIVATIFSMYFVAIVDTVLTKKRIKTYSITNIIKIIVSSENAQKLFLCLFIAIILFIIVLILSNTKDYKSKQMTITPDIETPVPAGQGQCGTASWLPKKQYEKVFEHFEINIDDSLLSKVTKASLTDIKDEMERIKKVEGEIKALEKELKIADNQNDEKEIIRIKDLINEKEHELTSNELIIPIPTEAYDNIDNIKQGCDKVIKKGGVVIGKENIGTNKEKIFYIGADVHTMVLGATRSGKSRTVVLQTIGGLSLAGESMICTDPKGELYEFTNYYLKMMGYKVYAIDFKNPKKSTKFNFLQPVIDCIDKGDIPGAIDATWDITSQLVGESKGEKIWSDGEASMIAAAIMAVVYDNRTYENHKYRNLTNVYYFISQMCTPIQVDDEFIVPLNKYMKDLPFEHPSKGLLSVGEIAPSRTRGSFYTSALMTLKLFTNPLIADMTNSSDYDMLKVGSEKTAIFIILPDDRATYHSLASLYVTQQYQQLSKASDMRGGRLQRRTNFICDEFGNFVKIPIFPSMLTVGGGKGIRFNIFLQGFSQLEEKYEDKTARTILSNCENWIYLQSDDETTLKSLSDKLGKYTISSYTLSGEHRKFSNPSSSHSINLIGRELLTVDEIKKIKRPYSLLTSRNNPAIMMSPDLSKWHFNSIFGMGDEEHNRILRLARGNVREERHITSKLELWGIWEQYTNMNAIKQQKIKENMSKIMKMQQN